MNVTIKCPFCGNDDIEYGLALCRDCHAEIEYDLSARNVPMLPEIANRVDQLQAQVDPLLVAFSKRKWWMPNASLQREIESCINQQEELLALETNRMEGVVREYLATRDRESEVSFTRNEKTIAIKIWLPAEGA